MRECAVAHSTHIKFLFDSRGGHRTYFCNILIYLMFKPLDLIIKNSLFTPLFCKIEEARSEKISGNIEL